MHRRRMIQENMATKKVDTTSLPLLRKKLQVWMEIQLRLLLKWYFPPKLLLETDYVRTAVERIIIIMRFMTRTG